MKNSADISESVITGNTYDKYASSNPIVKMLMKRFMKQMHALLEPEKTGSEKTGAANHHTLIELGCGEGELVPYFMDWFPALTYFGSDIDPALMKQNQERFSNTAVRFDPVSVYESAAFYQELCADLSIDMIIMAEVLEHLEYPERALEQVFALHPKVVLVSVPNEPIWRLLNMARFKYMKDFGNTPGHIQHWSKSSFRTMIQPTIPPGYALELTTVFPWIMGTIKQPSRTN